MSEPHNFTCKVQLSKWTCNQKAPSGANMFANTFDSNLAGASFELMTPSPMLAANRFADLPARPGYPKNLHLILRYGNREGKDRGVLNWTCRVKSRTRRCRIWTLDSFFSPKSPRAKTCQMGDYSDSMLCGCRPVLLGSYFCLQLI